VNGVVGNMAFITELLKKTNGGHFRNVAVMHSQYNPAITQQNQNRHQYGNHFYHHYTIRLSGRKVMMG
jgi:hypothetical protein